MKLSSSINLTFLGRKRFTVTVISYFSVFDPLFGVNAYLFAASSAMSPWIREAVPARYIGSVVSDSATPWTVARQAPLSMGLPRQESWSGLPCPLPGVFLTQDWSHVSHGACTGSWVLYRRRHLASPRGRVHDLNWSFSSLLAQETSNNWPYSMDFS